jgi:hypothetical protein
MFADVMWVLHLALIAAFVIGAAWNIWDNLGP